MLVPAKATPREWMPGPSSAISVHSCGAYWPVWGPATITGWPLAVWSPETSAALLIPRAAPARSMVPNGASSVPPCEAMSPVSRLSMLGPAPPVAPVPGTIYSTTNWWQTCTGNAGSFGDTSALWLARYGPEPGGLPAGWGVHTIWQYSSDPVDQNW